jgi:hypothetical protein
MQIGRTMTLHRLRGQSSIEATSFLRLIHWLPFNHRNKVKSDLIPERFLAQR